MFYRKIYLFFLVFFSFFLSQAKTNIYVEVMNISENTKVALIKYDYEVIEIEKTFVKSGSFNFNNLENFNEGVYTIIINYPPETSLIKQPIYQFNIILDKSEDFINIHFNPSIKDSINIKESEINKNYFDYLKLESKLIHDLDLNMQLKINKNQRLDTINKKNTDIKLIIDELRKKYIAKNFNKWSTALVKNSTSFLKLNPISKNEYWNLFETDNPKLINTPIFNDICQKYIMQFYNNSNEGGYKEGFEDIIQQFSKNIITKKWAFHHVITGLKTLGNENLKKYFSTKYNLKI